MSQTVQVTISSDPPLSLLWSLETGTCINIVVKTGFGKFYICMMYICMFTIHVCMFECMCICMNECMYECTCAYDLNVFMYV